MPDNTTGVEKTQRSAAMSEFSPANFGVWMDGYKQAFENWVQSGDGAMKRAALLSEEIINFSRNRLQADLDAWKAIASCRNPSDFVELQRQYAQKASADYLEEASKLSTSMVAFLSEVAAPLQRPLRKF